MLEKIVAYMLKQKGMVIFLSLLIIAFGLYSYSTLPIDAFPDVTNVQVEVLVVVVISPSCSHAVNAKVRKVGNPFESAVTQISIEQGRRELRIRRLQGTSAAHNEQVVPAIIVEVTPRDARAHVLRQPRRAPAGPMGCPWASRPRNPTFLLRQVARGLSRYVRRRSSYFFASHSISTPDHPFSTSRWCVLLRCVPSQAPNSTHHSGSGTIEAIFPEGGGAQFLVTLPG